MFCAHLPAQRAFDRVVALEQRRQPGDLVLVQLAGVLAGLDAGLVAQLASDLIARRRTSSAARSPSACRSEYQHRANEAYVEPYSEFKSTRQAKHQRIKPEELKQ